MISWSHKNCHPPSTGELLGSQDGSFCCVNCLSSLDSESDIRFVAGPINESTTDVAANFWASMMSLKEESGKMLEF